ncbi:MAG: peptide-methionine (S)-S-oxide reductase MsrA [Alphaproteobacteria bacterium]|nr:peptide-methionine (S)-S-oxide reductase MsrA [Alphaproteobacteria bacterium]
MIRVTLIILGVLALGLAFINPPTLAVDGVLQTQGNDLELDRPKSYPSAIFAGGCFWCVESEFRTQDGVLYTRSGYIGGDVEDPKYQDITTGKTGHAEAVEVIYDPEKTSYEELTKFFLTKAHDPTQLNRQGVDVGTQYRSEIFYMNDEQKEIAERLIKEIDSEKLYDKPIVTKVSSATKFWEAEEYHQRYYEKYEEETGRIHPRVYYKRSIKAGAQN